MTPRRQLRFLGCGVIALVSWLGPRGGGFSAEVKCDDAVRVRCTRLTEQRGSSNCVVELEFTGDALIGKMGNFGAKVFRATDEAGNDLRLPGEPPFQGSGVAGDRSLSPLRGWFDFNGQQQRWRYAGVTLRPIPRTTKQLKELAGELELYSPTFTNGGVVVCEDFGRTPGTVFKNPALEKWQVHLTLHTKETCQAAQRTASPGAAFRPDAGRLFPSWPGTETIQNYLVFQATDPEKRIVGFALRGPDGKFLPIAYRNNVGDFYGLYFDSSLPQKSDLFVYLATPAAVEKFPFKLENLSLP